MINWVEGLTNVKKKATCQSSLVHIIRPIIAHLNQRRDSRVERAEGKIFGPRLGRTDREQRGPYILTESQIFSRPARPYSVNKHFIIWPLTVENSIWTYKIKRPRALDIKFPTSKICHLFLRDEQETHNSSKNTTHFMLKSQQKVDIKLSKCVKLKPSKT